MCDRPDGGEQLQHNREEKYYNYVYICIYTKNHTHTRLSPLYACIYIYICIKVKWATNLYTYIYRVQYTL